MVLKLAECIVTYIDSYLYSFCKLVELSTCKRTTMNSFQSVPDYLNKNIFPTLLAAMKEMLLEADRQNALKTHKCSFNGLDYLAEILWNRNSRHPSRSRVWQNVFDIPQFKLWLKSHPRPIYPKSWLWTREEAALRIQRNIRGWLVRKRVDVQEMRQFWKV
ncbi:IQ domain-containing protein K-like [Monomorium pharaonis]|uniref:IQ domain-containing protein K-like n=1 Tax=Monomorium pharaonis TaxID=307658 RepID=UPI00063F5207|nr:IQ domain-containing protein K-like [Monomorium pharaonis]